MTKTGYCQVLPDKIIVSRMGAVGNVANITTGNHISRILIIYSVLSISLFCLAYDQYINQDSGNAILFGCLGLYLFYNIIRSLNNSTDPVISRDKIKTVKFVKAIPSLTRAYFIIKFENEKGKVKQRLIMLPGSLSGGNTETERALKIMKDEGLLS